VVANPTIKVGSSSGSTNNTSAGIGGLGVGLTYYIMPLNVFLAGTVGFGPLSFSNNGTNSSTQNGLVGRFGLGKEWFVSQSWGLGIAGYVNFGVNPDQGTNPPTWKTVAPLVALSATFY